MMFPGPTPTAGPAGGVSGACGVVGDRRRRAGLTCGPQNVTIRNLIVYRQQPGYATHTVVGLCGFATALALIASRGSGVNDAGRRGCLLHMACAAVSPGLNASLLQ
jgi:hypothetical protein